MTPAQFLARLERGQIAPACLFLGPEAYQRKRARAALLRAALGDADRESSLTQYDLAETPLAEVIDDARALSLFASQRVIVAGNAEAALPRTRAGEDTEEDDAPAGSAAALAAYLKDPTPGVALLLDAPRFDFEGEDKRKQDRVRKFYAAVGDPVEFRRASADDARREAAALARRAGVTLPRTWSSYWSKPWPPTSRASPSRSRRWRCLRAAGP